LHNKNDSTTIYPTAITAGMRRWIAVYLAAALVCLVWMPSMAKAGKEGVFLSDTVYFTLEDAVLSSGSGSQTLVFTLRLNNGGSAEIDYNRFGVRVTTAQGGSYTAQLSQAGYGFVKSGTGENYVYVAKVPSVAKADDLYVTLSEWNVSANWRKDIGSLAVGKVKTLKQGGQQVTVNLADAASGAKNAYLTYTANKGFAVPEQGKWTISLTLDVNNASSDRVALASAPTYRLRSANGLSYPMAVSSPNGSELGGRQSAPIILTATMDERPELSGLRLEMIRSDGSVLVYLDVGSLFTKLHIGDSAAFEGQSTGKLSVEIGKALLTGTGDKQQAAVSVLLKNNGSTTVKVPALSGVFVSPEDRIDLDAYAAASSESYIAPEEVAVYQFAAVVPDGVDANSLQLVVKEQWTKTGAIGTANSNGSAANASASTTVIVPVLAVDLQGAFEAAGAVVSGPEYQWGTPIVFEPGSSLSEAKLDISVMELTSYTHADNAYRTAVAKFKFTNNSSGTEALPNFATQLVDQHGVSYPGTKQTTTMQQLIPNTSYVYSYSYLLPPGASENLSLQVLENTGTASYKLPIASYRVSVGHVDDTDAHVLSRELSFYPFKVTLEDWVIQFLFSNQSYTYLLNTSIDVSREEQVIVDNQFSVMELELVDSRNRVLGSTTLNFLGTNKLSSGRQKISFSGIKTEQFESPVTINIYEKMETQAGSVRRLVAVLKQK
jgi:hypothetical protein